MIDIGQVTDMPYAVKMKMIHLASKLRVRR